MDITFSDPLEFHHWLRLNSNRLRAYPPDQVALLAIRCGFTLEVICPAVVDRVSQIKKILAFWDSPLNDQWLDVTAYDRNGRTWGDK